MLIWYLVNRYLLKDKDTSSKEIHVTLDFEIFTSLFKKGASLTGSKFLSTKVVSLKKKMVAKSSNVSKALGKMLFFQSKSIDIFLISPRKRIASLGGSVGCGVRLETRRSRVESPPRSATFFRGDWSWNIFYSHSLPFADSRRAVVSFWRRNVHNTG